MKLKNNFTDKTRELFRDCYECAICISNGQDRGGLELHHITGRDSNKADNAIVLCGECHRHIGHSQEEEKFLKEKNKEMINPVTKTVYELGTKKGKLKIKGIKK